MAVNRILGLNSAGFNTSAAIVVNGELEFAVEEERLIREKRTRRFPILSVRESLAATGLRLEDLDEVAIAWNPAVNLEAFNLPQSQRHRYLGEIFYNVPNYLMSLKPDNEAAFSSQVIEFTDRTRLSISYVTHHLAHASTFFFSPYEQAAIMTVDAFGEKESARFARGTDNRIETLWSQEFPHSLGSFYSTMTEFLGFQPQHDEWKLMGASSYGDSIRFYERMRRLVSLRDDGGFELDLSCFNHYQFHRPRLFTPKLVEQLGVPPNRRDQPLTPEHYDLAAAAQRVMEDVYFHMLRRLHARTKLDRVVIAGGVAFNSVANGKVTTETPFGDVFVSPVPDDSGGSVGAAFYVYHQVHGQPRCYVMRANYLGPGYSDQEVHDTLDKFKVRHRVVPDPAATGAQLVAAGKIVGWFQGRLEFGDRALGNRSILADPRDPAMKDRVNETVKYREPFRPFAPSILAEHVDEYFVDAAPTPFMEKVFPIRADKRAEIPAVTHVDGSGRLQTVDRDRNPLYWQLIQEFYRLTGTPLVLNTSFNLKGEAMVCSPQDALRTFFSSGLDALVLGNCLVEK